MLPPVSSSGSGGQYRIIFYRVVFWWPFPRNYFWQFVRKTALLSSDWPMTIIWLFGSFCRKIRINAFSCHFLAKPQCHILVHLFYLCPSFCPSSNKNIINIKQRRLWLMRRLHLTVLTAGNEPDVCDNGFPTFKTQILILQFSAGFRSSSRDLDNTKILL